MRPEAETARRSTREGSRAVVTRLGGLLALLLLAAPLATPESIFHQHVRWDAPCAAGPGATDSGDHCADHALRDDAGAGHEPAANESLNASSSLCLACANGTGKSQIGATPIHGAAAGPELPALRVARAAFVPDAIAAGAPAPRAPPVL